MSKRTKAPAKKHLDYPLETEGSRLARKIREQCNKLTREEREELHRQAMQVYYGGQWTTETTGPGHKLPA